MTVSVSLKESRLAAESDEEKNESEKRGRTIVRTSLIGIFANVLLAGFKAVVGAASGSVAIVMDAVNNLSDAASSIITIVERDGDLSDRAVRRHHIASGVR